MNRKIFMAYIEKEKQSRVFRGYETRMHQNSYGYEMNLYSALRNTGFIDRNVETFGYERDEKTAPTEYVPCTLDIDSFSITYSGYPHEFGIYCNEGLFYNQAIALNCKNMAEMCDGISIPPTESYRLYEETITFDHTNDPAFTSRASVGCEIFIPVCSDFGGRWLSVIPEDAFTRKTLYNVRNAGEFVHTNLFDYDPHGRISIYFGKTSFNYLSGDLYVDMVSEQNNIHGIMTGKISAICSLSFTINRYVN